MASIKSKNTKLERELLEGLALECVNELELHPSDIFGTPDLVHRSAGIAIFVDSCFWHGCAAHLRMPSTNRDYWIHKISRNRRRDHKVNRELRKSGWSVIRVWEHSLKQSRSSKWWFTRLRNRLTIANQFQVISPDPS